jgi:hypothetical protein
MQQTESQVGDEKFFGAIVSAISQAAPHVVPVVISAVRKDYQPPEDLSLALSN